MFGRLTLAADTSPAPSRAETMRGLNVLRQTLQNGKGGPNAQSIYFDEMQPTLPFKQYSTKLFELMEEQILGDVIYQDGTYLHGDGDLITPKRGSLPLAKLHATQKSVSVKGVKQYLSGHDAPAPKVAFWKNEYLILDGHHRVVAQLFMGRKVVPIFLYVFQDQAAKPVLKAATKTTLALCA